MKRRQPQGGKVADPVWRKARAQKAGAAQRAAYARRREALGETFDTKGEAYVAGYRVGYQTAMHWWARRFTRGEAPRTRPKGQAA